MKAINIRYAKYEETYFDMNEDTRSSWKQISNRVQRKRSYMRNRTTKLCGKACYIRLSLLVGFVAMLTGITLMS